MEANTESNFITIVREFDAPRELVWQVWTDPVHAVHWWGPKDFTCPVYRADFRLGGRYHGCMRSSDGQDFWSGGEFKEIVPPERIVTTDFFSNPEGDILDPEAAGMPPGMPKIMEVTTTFEELEGGRTRLTVVQSMPAEIAKQLQADVGWVQMLDKMAEYLVSQQAD